jgi:hypothetical protein
MDDSRRDRGVRSPTRYYFEPQLIDRRNPGLIGNMKYRLNIGPKRIDMRNFIYIRLFL